MSRVSHPVSSAVGASSILPSGLQLDADLSDLSEDDVEVADCGSDGDRPPQGMRLARTLGFAVQSLPWTENLESGGEDSEEVSMSSLMLLIWGADGAVMERIKHSVLLTMVATLTT